jgi:hypothetical protein
MSSFERPPQLIQVSDLVIGNTPRIAKDGRVAP